MSLVVLSFPACPPFSSNCSLQTQRNFLEVSSLMISLNEVFPVIQILNKYLTCNKKWLDGVYKNISRF